MPDIRRRTLETLFHRALAVPPGERKAFLASLTEEDPAIVAEVEHLLEADRATNELRVPPPFESANEPAAVPDHVGRYSVLGVLGRGGMGVVYAALDPRLERRIALKVLPETVARDPDRRLRFEREARLLAATNHPNIATVHSLETDGEVHFLTMEEVPGASLGDRLAERPLSVDETLSIGRQIARAVEAAHDRGIVHRDLKPANIMVTPANAVKVLDFGLAMSGSALGSRETENSPSDAELVAGTPGYMSPEHLRGEPVGLSTDVFAFGCVLYESLTGLAPFGGATPEERIHATLETDPDLDRLPAETPPLVRELLGRCLPKNVDERQCSMTEARRTLDEVIEDRKLQRLLQTRMKQPKSTPNNLPRQVTSFVGRQLQKKELTERLSRSRLVTLTGVGGCGKTRLALETAAERLSDHQDGLWLVELAAIEEPELVVRKAMSVLGLREARGQTLLEVVLDEVRDKSVLFVIDNCEHLLGSVAALVEALLQAGPNLRILATSREPLGIYGETIYPVPTLGTPTGATDVSVNAVLDSEAAQLFLDRAHAINPSARVTRENASAVAEICRRLDGIPLALEMAAARMNVLSVDDLAKSLDQRFKVLSDGKRKTLPRHRTLQALIDWSYEQLSEKEQVILQRLSIFKGGWTLAGAEAVCAGDTVETWEVVDLFSRLVDKSLVERDAEGSLRSGQTRYRMLETIAEYARERLEESEGVSVARIRHRDHFLTVTDAAKGPLSGANQATWLARLAVDHENLRRALTDGLTDEDDPATRLRLTWGLYRYWLVVGGNEGLSICERLLAHPRAGKSLDRARVLTVAAVLAYEQGDLATTRAHCEEGIPIFQEEGRGQQQGVANMLTILGNVAIAERDLETARATLQESLSIFEDIGNRHGFASALNNLAVVAKHQQNYEAARNYSQESLAVRREIGDPAGVVQSLTTLGSVFHDQGDRMAAMAHFEECLEVQQSIGHRRGIGSTLVTLGYLRLELEDRAASREHLEKGLAILREHGEVRPEAHALRGLGLWYLSASDHDSARSNIRDSLVIFQRAGNSEGIIKSLEAFAALALHLQSPSAATRALGAAGALRETTKFPRSPIEMAEFETIRSDLRSTLGGPAFEAAWMKGGATPVEDAIEQAIALSYHE